VHILPLFRSIPAVRLTALFAPEHGFWGAAQDQVPVGRTRDRSGLAVHSLYGATRRPTDAMLKDLDVLVCDLQDVGSRYYTFVWTMLLAMQTASLRRIPFLVLDRPNPLGGAVMEGHVLDMAFASFVGLAPVPVRHGLTIGEMALFLNDRFRLNCDLAVVPMARWNREMLFDQTGLPWVMPSPNMPTLETAVVYPGSCLIEGTNLSEGRGTTRPFELIGAPYVEPHRLASHLAGLRLPGVFFRPCYFEPTFHKWMGKTCGGIQLHVTDRASFLPYLTGLAVIRAARRLFPRDFRWRRPPYEYEKKKWPFDILCGTDRVRLDIERGASPSMLRRRWSDLAPKFRSQFRRYFLYD